MTKDRCQQRKCVLATFVCRVRAVLYVVGLGRWWCVPHPRATGGSQTWPLPRDIKSDVQALGCNDGCKCPQSMSTGSSHRCGSSNTQPSQGAAAVTAARKAQQEMLPWESPPPGRNGWGERGLPAEGEGAGSHGSVQDGREVR